MRALLFMFTLACGSASPGPRSETTGDSIVTEPSEPEPVEPASEPPTSTANDAIPTTYYVDGNRVERSEFEALHARLTIEADAFEGETVENEDGSYGGSSESYRARLGETEYIYTVGVVRQQDDSTVETRSLRRAP